MARFKTTGLDATIRQMKELGELTGEIADKMLVAGAEEVKKAWKKSAERHNLRLTGQMMNSIGYPKKPTNISGIKTMDIYPQGKSTYTEKDGKRIERKKAIVAGLIQCPIPAPDEAESTKTRSGMKYCGTPDTPK